MEKFLSTVFCSSYELSRVNSKVFAISILTLLLLTAFGQANAAPFEIRGYRQCMTLEQTQHVAEERSHTLKDISNGNYLILENGVKIGNIFFEKNRLNFVTWDFGGGIEQIVKQLEQLSKEGLKKTDVSWRSQLGNKDELIYDLTIYFAGLSKDFYVRVTSSESTDLRMNGGGVSWQALRCK